MKNIKILITGPALNGSGGVAHYYSAILPWLKEIPGLEFHYHSIGGHTQGGVFGRGMRDQIGAYQLLKKCKPDLTVINPTLSFKSFMRDALIILSAKRNSGKVIVFFRGWNLAFESVVELYLKKFFKITYGRADIFIVLASEFEYKLRSWGIRCPIIKETTTVANEIIIDTKNLINIRRQAKNDKLKVIFLSRLEKDKGIYETLEAVYLLDKEKVPIVLTVAGDGSEFNNIQQWVREHKLDKVVTLSGYIGGERKREAFLSHDVFCFPTQHGEGMPNSLLEAMAAGLAVVTTEIGGIKDFFEEDKMGFLVQPNNIEEIVARLRIIAENRKLCASMGIYNHEFAKLHFFAPVVAERIRKILIKAIEQTVGT